MLQRNVIESKGDRQVLHLLKLFYTVPYDLMEQYLKKKNNSPLFEPKESLKKLCAEKYIYYSASDKCYRIIDRYPKQQEKICVLATYLHFSKNDEDKIEKARYPFDYIFEDNKRLFQLIDFTKDGEYKLRFRKEMEQGGDLREVIPIIMLINSGPESIQKINSAGEYYLIPREDYYIAQVKYIPGSEDLDKIEVVSKKYKGGTLIEY